ncbi:MAG: septum formation protein Maf [Bacilli bacterium]|nr:septum formation protein Maf [Bacilli bacterium]
MIILGSKSPRRKEILEMVGLPFNVVIEDVDEDIKCSDYLDYPRLTAKKKGEPLVALYPNDIVLTADTIVYLDNKILGKPKTKEEAYEMIKLLSGRSHIVVTGVYIKTKDNEYNYSVETEVFVSKLSEKEINDYINTKEPYDKAGAYAIQGIFGKYIEKINGDYYNVMGLPINSIYEKIKEEI